jgi:hypothetical protein
LPLVRARMPMKVGKKMVEAKIVTINAKYMVVLLSARGRIDAGCGAVPCSRG